MKNIRVYIDPDKHEIYQKLSKKGGDNPDYQPFQTMKDVFMLAAALGAKNNAHDPLNSSRDIFNSDVFDTRVDVPVLAAIAFQHEKDFSILTDEKRIVEVVQAYANGGINFLVEEVLNNPGKPLNNLVQLIIESADIKQQI